MTALESESSNMHKQPTKTLWIWCYRSFYGNSS